MLPSWDKENVLAKNVVLVYGLRRKQKRNKRRGLFWNSVLVPRTQNHKYHIPMWWHFVNSYKNREKSINKSYSSVLMGTSGRPVVARWKYPAVS